MHRYLFHNIPSRANMRMLTIIALALGVALIGGGIIVTIVTLATKQAKAFQGAVVENDGKDPTAAHMKQEKVTECDSQPCQNGGQCTAVADGYLCNCPDGFKGTQCQTKINRCDSRPCKNNAACIDLGTAYRCDCLHGFTGKQCENKIQYCQSGPCKNNAVCTEHVDGYKCSCQVGYTGNQCQNDIDDCAQHPCKNNGTCVDQVADYFCQCLPGYSGKQCEEVPYDVSLRVKAMKFEEDMKEIFSSIYNKTLAALQPMIDAVCKKMTFCEPKGLRSGSVIVDFRVLTPEEPRLLIKEALKEGGFNGTEIGTIQKHEVISVGPCGRFRPCRNGGTCAEVGNYDYRCCCPAGWTGKHCENRALDPKPYGPQLECINDLKGDFNGINYFGTKNRTTSGKTCQKWSSQYPHSHPYSKELGSEHNYCRNRVHGYTGLYKPWCYVDDSRKLMEFCDTVPYCSNQGQIFQKPPTKSGCYSTVDKGASYKGPVFYTKSGKLCAPWYIHGYPHITDNYCRNPKGSARRKPWCWTKDGTQEDCDIPVCSLPRPEDSNNKCKVDTIVSDCRTRTVVKGRCHYTVNLNNECGFTVVNVNERMFDIYTSRGVKELHWNGHFSIDRFTDKYCNVVFEFKDKAELIIRQHLCGWCTMMTSQSIKAGSSSCPVPGQLPVMASGTQ